MEDKICGYAGAALFVDLTDEKINKIPLDEELINKFFGARGINMAYITKFLPAGVHPFSPENVIVVGVGPLVGTPFPSAGKICITTKNAMPADYDERKCFVGSAKSGTRRFGPMLKMAGYDHLIIKGRSAKPVYLKIIDDDVEIVDARDLWGKGIYETEDELRRRHGGDIGTMAIGPAGENLVRFAYATIDTSSTAGRSGIGAVMGSKNLKAIVAKGTKGTKIYNAKDFLKLVQRVRDRVAKHPGTAALRKYGFMGYWETWQLTLDRGSWAVHDYGHFFDRPNYDRMLFRFKADAACPLGCHGQLRVPEGSFKGSTTYTLNTSSNPRIGNTLQINKLEETLAIGSKLDANGLDCTTFINMCNVVASLHEKGIIGKEELGFEFSREVNSYLKLLDLIVKREKIGEVLANGFFEVGKRFNVDVVKDLHIELVKGVDPIYDARFTSLDPLRCTYITSPRPHHGGAHTIFVKPSDVAHSPTPIDAIRNHFRGMGFTDDELDKMLVSSPIYAGFSLPKLTIASEHACVIYDSLGVCSILACLGMIDVITLSEAYQLVTGIDKDAKDLMNCAERVFNLEKAVNVREGFKREDDWLEEWLHPKRTPEPWGCQAAMTDYYRTRILTRDDIHHLLDEYYELRGWSVEKGIPTREKLIALGLEEIAEQLEKTKIL